MSRKMLSVLICALVALNEAVVPVSENETDASSYRENVAETLNEDVAVGDYCSFGWTHYKSRCFVYISCPMSWTEAQRHCQLMNANLASVHGDEEYKALRKVIKYAAKEDKVAWIGGSDIRKEGKWQWADGSRFRYTFWCPNEPNDRRREDCLLVNWKGTGCWNDSKCGSERPFVCAK